ncbi:MAG: D-alanyl-D-alanine carboxypeptidase [Chloroflexi bacterium]|nr:D-alanyl-D-alanine carboxypeptidase [Chloroflexota bacterium]
MLRWLLPLCVAVWMAAAPAAQGRDARSADWLRTVRDTPLWSGSDAASVQFTLLPLGSFLQPRAGSDTGRLLVYYPGDGGSRQAGLAWVAGQDVAPSGPPPWIVSSELDGDNAAPVSDDESVPQRTLPVAPPPVTAAEVAVVDDASGLLLYGANPHAREAPASTTKIATAVVTLEHAADLDQPVRVSVDGLKMAATDGSSIMGLSPGQHVTLETLLDGLLLPSGNDAAEQLAISVGESRASFVDWMNALATDELGLRDTHFVNPSGLDADGHYSSAYDLAQLARRAMREDVFREIVATPEIRAEGFVLVGHNPLIGVYPGADGVKTGTTDDAGKVLVGSAMRNGHRVYVVVMHSDDIQTDTAELLDWAWQEFSWS